MKMKMTARIVMRMGYSKIHADYKDKAVGKEYANDDEDKDADARLRIRTKR